jgi:hypothetical protein
MPNEIASERLDLGEDATHPKATSPWSLCWEPDDTGHGCPALDVETWERLENVPSPPDPAPAIRLLRLDIEERLKNIEDDPATSKRLRENSSHLPAGDSTSASPCRQSEEWYALVRLRMRVEALEQIQKKPRVSFPRSCWKMIRNDAQASRAAWCRRGEVFELYRDGVGPLLPSHNEGPNFRRTIVVHSPESDEAIALDEHPDPRHPDRYVRVVLVCSPFPLPPLHSPLL